jgi:hypothetical protein
MSVVTTLRRSIYDNYPDDLPALTGTADDISRARIIRRRQINELTDLIWTYQRVVPWHSRPSADKDQFLRARQISLRFYETQTDAAVILRYYDPGYSPES